MYTHRVTNAGTNETIDVPFTEEEIAIRIEEENKNRLAGIRKIRNALLLDCDWTQNADVPMDDSTRILWQVYRQELRDMLTDIVDSDNPVWPIRPDGKTIQEVLQTTNRLSI